jgi:hypothetical protein
LILLQNTILLIKSQLVTSYTLTHDGRKASRIGKRYEKYGRKVSWKVKRYEKYGRNPVWIVKWYGKYRGKVSWIVKRYGKYGRFLC